MRFNINAADRCGWTVYTISTSPSRTLRGYIVTLDGYFRGFAKYVPDAHEMKTLLGHVGLPQRAVQVKKLEPTALPSLILRNDDPGRDRIDETQDEEESPDVGFDYPQAGPSKHTANGDLVKRGKAGKKAVSLPLS